MRIKGIKPVTVRKNGRVFRYFYHRATGSRIMAAFGTPGFAAEAERLDQRANEMAPRDGSLKALITAYKQSPEFIDLAQRTRADYEKVFDYLAPIGNMAVIEVDTPFLYDLRDRAYKKRKRRFANYVVQVVRLLFAWGKPRGHLDENPAVNIKSIRRPKTMPRANRPWTDEERDIVLAEAKVELRAMVAVAMFAGLREGDACAAGIGAYDGERIESIASKNHEPLWIPAHFRLRKILDEARTARREKLRTRAKRRKVLPIDPPTLCVTSRGMAWTESGFRASFFALIRRLTAAGRIQSGLTFHGLRHTIGKLIIEAGGTKEDVGMILGDRSMAMMEFYSREHEKRGRNTATMLKLERIERRRMENAADENGKPFLENKTVSK